MNNIDALLGKHLIITDGCRKFVSHVQGNRHATVGATGPQIWTNQSDKRHRNNDVMSVRSGRGVGVKQPYCNCIDLIEEFRAIRVFRFI